MTASGTERLHKMRLSPRKLHSIWEGQDAKNGYRKNHFFAHLEHL